MSKDRRFVWALMALGTVSGCQSYAPQWQLRQSQLRTYQAYHHGQQLAGELGQSQMMASQLQMEKQHLAARASQLEQNLAVANQRLNNLAQERSKLHEEYKTLLTGLPAPNNPLSGSMNGRFEDLCRRYPQFEFDPVTGVSKFNGDLLFPVGSNQLRPEGLKLLQEFANIMNSGDARQFNILVVGHTDDQPVVTSTTREKHETNWELSAHRATAVVRQLGKY
jgi:chemotaxis protein MotB